MLKVHSIFYCLEYAGAPPALLIRRSLFLFFAVCCFAAFPVSASARAVSHQADGRNAETAPFSSIREAYRQKAFDLWKRAADLQIDGRYEEALEKYREGLGYHEDPRVREHVWKLEETLAARRSRENAREKAARREAAELWKEAAELQQAGWFEDALRKYKEGLELSDDPRVREHVRKLEVYIEHLRHRGLLPLLVLRREHNEEKLSKRPREGVFLSMWYGEKSKKWQL